MRDPEVVGRLTLRRAAEMTPQGRKDVAAWLRRHASMIVKDGKNYSKLFTGKYFVPAR